MENSSQFLDKDLSFSYLDGDDIMELVDSALLSFGNLKPLTLLDGTSSSFVNAPQKEDGSQSSLATNSLPLDNGQSSISLKISRQNKRQMELVPSFNELDSVEPSKTFNIQNDIISPIKNGKIVEGMTKTKKYLNTWHIARVVQVDSPNQMATLEYLEDSSLEHLPLNRIKPFYEDEINIRFRKDDMVIVNIGSHYYTGLVVQVYKKGYRVRIPHLKKCFSVAEEKTFYYYHF
ncbi:hypothetical protein PPL_01363 [Heterostelium album PN500]|uniref:Uncharacterized protein n=1 Tax=Heterostelium pallidum (strain ATCC 26659 / Pp 5 / PN500) TaxID=670386 RepID=D3AZ23_HETP5|nr:hypothetical protein PPL_01363 [Heterostelium album PN500]EFA85580.1 hypothetical protein PPL_01363 [Heterostelium album PN500]|eukprot:XP_020437687.1 hypothetical protein PPL_01363 [Heterostelium album PN500]